MNPTIQILLSILLFGFVSSGCDLFTSDNSDLKDCVDPKEESLPPEGTPVQFCIENDPEIQIFRDGLENERYGLESSYQIRFSVEARDSLAHVNWMATRLHVETSRGFDEELLIDPFYCLTPSDRSDEWPLSYDWWHCNAFTFISEEKLGDATIGQLEEGINGRLRHRWEFHDPRALYRFQVATGRPAIDEAIEKVREMGLVDFDHEPTISSHEPDCVVDDRIPPPPCPDWLLGRNYLVALGGDEAEEIPIEPGGWVRATYTQPDGEKRTTKLDIPQ